MSPTVQSSASDARAQAWSDTSNRAGPLQRVLSRFGAVLLAVLFVGAAAQMAVPMPGTPVPVTLQDLAVLLVGIVLGPRLGAAALLAYLAAGAAGAPLFSNGHAGLAWLFGPTGGYLLAYPAAAWVAGVGARRPRRALWVLAGVVLAQAVIFASGLGQVLLLTGRDLGVALALGVVPFLPGAAIKTALACAFVWTLDRFGPGPRDAGPGELRDEAV